MRSELEGKKHVESYLHALTHELKSPLTAIEGAARSGVDTACSDAECSIGTPD